MDIVFQAGQRVRYKKERLRNTITGALWARKAKDNGTIFTVVSHKESEGLVQVEFPLHDLDVTRAHGGPHGSPYLYLTDTNIELVHQSAEDLQQAHQAGSISSEQYLDSLMAFHKQERGESS